MNSIIGFFTLWLLKMIARLPASPFDYDDVLEDLDTIMGYVNWFIPFYTFSQIFTVWSVCFWGSLIVLLIIRWVMRTKTGG